MAKPTKHYKKWRIRWVCEKGLRQSEVFNDFKTASYELKKRESFVQEVKLGLRIPLTSKKTFSDICTYWIEKRLPLKRSQKDDQSIIKTHLLPAFGSLLLKDITVEKVDIFTRERIHLNKKTVSNHITLLITLLRLAVDLNWLAKVPKIKKPKINLFSSDFSYLRTQEEVDRFLEAAKSESDVAYLMYATAIYTGLRAGELAALKFSDIKFDGSRSIITVQKSFKGVTKSDKVRYIPILAPIYNQLLERRDQNINDLVFPNRDNQMYLESGRIFQEVFHKVLERAGFPRIERNNKSRRYIVFHDLRHTFASHWVMNGGDVYKLQKILGHANIQMTMRYAHLSPHAFEADFNRLGSNEAQPFSNIISINSRR